MPAAFFAADGLDRAALHAFMQRVQATLGHDLRTPLGTIVNYASVLEEDGGLDEARRRELPRRIRGQAMQAADMLQMLLDATLLAASVPRCIPTDPAALLRSIVAEIEGDELLAAPALPEEVETMELDPGVVGFAWRAFLLLEKSLTSRPLGGARATIVTHEDGLRLDLAFRASDVVGPALIDLDAFNRGSLLDVPATNRFALRLSRDLVRSRGGELLLRGRVGADAAICLVLPPAP